MNRGFTCIRRCCVFSFFPFCILIIHPQYAYSSLSTGTFQDLRVTPSLPSDTSRPSSPLTWERDTGELGSGSVKVMGRGASGNDESLCIQRCHRMVKIDWL